MYKPEISYEEFLKKELEKNPELNLKDIEVLKKRLEANKDLPKIENKLIVIYLHTYFFDVDAAYKALVANCKYRKELPQVFANIDPSTEELRRVFETMTICEVPDSSSCQKRRIIFTNFKNPDPQKYDYVQSSKYFFMMLEHLVFTNGTFDGIVLAMNSTGMNWRHITKTPMGTMKKLLGFVQEGFPVRLREVHILNSGSIVSTLYNILKPVLRKSLIDMLKIHPEGSKEVFKYVPIEVMPTEIGGDGKSHYEYSEDTYKKIMADRDWFLNKH